jgi:hypothetical protein
MESGERKICFSYHQKHQIYFSDVNFRQKEIDGIHSGD